MYTRRTAMLVITSGIAGLSGCASSDNDNSDSDNSDDIVLEETGMASRDSKRFELDEGDTVSIELDVRERSELYDEILVQIETVEDGTIQEWSFPESDSEWSAEFTAPSSSEYTLRITQFGIADLVISEVE